jgi:hypothetical protein
MNRDTSGTRYDDAVYTELTHVLDVACPLARAEVMVHSLDDDLILHLPGNDDVFVLNRTGARIWALCDGTHTVHQIAEEIADTYEVASDRAASDVDALAKELRSAGLLEIRMLPGDGPGTVEQGTSSR